MNDNKNSFYKVATINMHVLFVLCAFGMIGFAIYLTNHYFQMMYPTGLGAATLCDINSFFNCDITTFSIFSNVLGVPISVFGLLLGVIILGGYFVSSPGFSSTVHMILRINLVGCLVLLVYSLVFLKGLCPFCTLYYICSAGAWYSMHHFKVPAKIDLVPFVSIGAIYLVAFGITWKIVDDKKSHQDQLAKDLIRQFDTLPKLGAPAQESPYRLASSTEKFGDAPIQITKFSDFQCPACKMLSETLNKIAKRYPGKINIQYVFYPLDPSCNPNMQQPLHNYACKASYLAACLPGKFPQVEHDIFENQNDLTDKWLENYAKRENVLDCYKDPATKQKVVDLIAQASPFNVKSTPTSLLNGVKIEGALPLKNLTMILDEIIRRHDGK